MLSSASASASFTQEDMEDLMALRDKPGCSKLYVADNIWWDEWNGSLAEVSDFQKAKKGVEQELVDAVVITVHKLGEGKPKTWRFLWDDLKKLPFHISTLRSKNRELSSEEKEYFNIIQDSSDEEPTAVEKLMREALAAKKLQEEKLKEKKKRKEKERNKIMNK